MSAYSKTIDYYNANAGDLAQRYLTLDPKKLYAQLTPILDKNRAKGEILDVGGGIGRDAIFFSSRYNKDAYIVEPSRALRDSMTEYLTGQNYAPEQQTKFYDATKLSKDYHDLFLFDDKLPYMKGIMNHHEKGTLKSFSFINVNAIWQHIDPKFDRDTAAKTLECLLSPGGIISVKGRNIPSPEQQDIAWNTTADELREQFSGLTEILVEEQPDYTKPGTDFRFVNAIFQKPV